MKLKLGNSLVSQFDVVISGLTRVPVEGNLNRGISRINSSFNYTRNNGIINLVNRGISHRSNNNMISRTVVIIRPERQT